MRAFRFPLRNPFALDSNTSTELTARDRPNGASNLLPKRARCMSLAVERSDEFHAVYRVGILYDCFDSCIIGRPVDNMLK